jgi:5-methylcytosine-specific restriction endonuclease McrA
MTIRRPNAHCAVCSKSMYRRPIELKTGKVFCSRKCCGIDQRIERLCYICGKSYIGAKRTCSRICANKARSGIKYMGVNYANKARNGSLLKERLAQIRGGSCERCGENNYAILQVHHIHERHKGGSDTLSNLEMLCPNCHATHHLGKSLYKRKKMI